MSNNRFKPKKVKGKKEKKEKTNNPDLHKPGNVGGVFKQNSSTKKVHKNRKF